MQEVASTQIFRIYALSGRFILDPLSFALGDFLVSAFTDSPILVKARGPVIRGYVKASDVAQTALFWLMNQENPCGSVSTITHIVALASLAPIITSMFQLPPHVSEAVTEPPNSYSDTPSAFLSMMNFYGLKSMPLADQILDTTRGLSST